jgi:transcriptional regulator
VKIVVRADSDGERQDRGGAKPWALSENPERVDDVLAKTVDQRRCSVPLHHSSRRSGLSLPRCSRRTMAKPADLLQGTLDMLILKAVSLGPLHGYGVLLRIQQISRNRLEIQQGSLYPALYRLEHQGLIESEWGESENKRKARFYRLTAAGRRQLQQETRNWNRMTDIIAGILNTQAEEA